MIDEALRDPQSYQTVKNMIEEDRIHMPKNLRVFVRQVFNVMKRSRFQTPLELNNWLKKHVFDNQHYRSIEPPAHTCDNYDEIFGYLVRSKNAIKSQQKALLADQMLFGYFLNLLCVKHFNEYVCGGKRSTLQTLLADHIGISISYANRLRWIGKLRYRFQKLKYLSLSPHELFKKQRDITNLFRHHLHLANEWKLEAREMDMEAE
jgi:hypothetical protein